MNAHPIRSRLGRTLAVVVAGTVVGVTGALIAAADERPSRPADHYQADREAIADWAEANDLAGLSPASMSQVNLDARVFRMAAEYRAIAEFARREGLAGLSPAWMEPIDD